MAGGLYLITTVTHGRRPLFAHATSAACVGHTAASPALWTPGRLWAWVLMPDHWHGLVELGKGQNLSTMIARFKGSSSRSLGKACPASGLVWQKGFHDRALRRSDDLRTVAGYILDNPLRARLVERLEDYPYWGCAWLERASDLSGLDCPPGRG